MSEGFEIFLQKIEVTIVVQKRLQINENNFFRPFSFLFYHVFFSFVIISCLNFS
jgi:hypothetical protein